MSEETAAPATAAAPAAPAAPAPKKPGPPAPMLIGVVALALVAGLAAGMFVVGPRLAARPSDAQTASAAGGHGESKGSKDKKEGHGKKEEHGRPVHRLDNIIVNPAGSMGTRFLLATVAFEVADEKYRDDLRAREVELRDVVISTFERHTLEELTRPGARDSMRAELTAAVAPMVGEGGALRVFLPQFVIQ